MSKYELKRQIMQTLLRGQLVEYAENNLYGDTILEAVKELLNKISNELYENGYINESNKLTTCELIIKKVLEGK